jgi:putative Mg2+ transporter-C (MgtC) family protein
VDRFDVFLHSRFASLGWSGEALIELMLAAVCGGLIGLEREIRGRQAGFRTNLLVCVGSALVMIVSNHVARTAWPVPAASNIQVNLDPARIAYGVMAGIGFLGAGTIVQTRGSVRGLTTAAGLWCVAALGLAAGLGMYLVTTAATILVLVALWILDHFESFLPTTHFRGISVRCEWTPGAIERVVNWLKKFHFTVIDVRFERSQDLNTVDVEVRVSFRKKHVLYDLEREAQTERDFHLMAIREP